MAASTSGQERATARYCGGGTRSSHRLRRLDPRSTTPTIGLILVAFLASMGWIADLPEVDRLPLLDEVRSLLAAAEYQQPWETHVHWVGPEWSRLCQRFGN